MNVIDPLSLPTFQFPSSQVTLGLPAEDALAPLESEVHLRVAPFLPAHPPYSRLKQELTGSVASLPFQSPQAGPTAEDRLKPKGAPGTQLGRLRARALPPALESLSHG